MKNSYQTRHSVVQHTVPVLLFLVVINSLSHWGLTNILCVPHRSQLLIFSYGRSYIVLGPIKIIFFFLLESSKIFNFGEDIWFFSWKRTAWRTSRVCIFNSIQNEDLLSFKFEGPISCCLTIFILSRQRIAVETAFLWLKTILNPHNTIIQLYKRTRNPLITWG